MRRTPATPRPGKRRRVRHAHWDLCFSLRKSATRRRRCRTAHFLIALIAPDSDRSRRALGARLCVDPLRQDRQEFLRPDLRRGGAEGLRSPPAVRDAGALALVALGRKHPDPQPFLTPPPPAPPLLLSDLIPSPPT